MSKRVKMNNTVKYTAHQLPNRTYIWANVSSSQLKLLHERLPKYIVTTDLGMNGYLLDFKPSEEIVNILTEINGKPIEHTHITYSSI